MSLEQIKTILGCKMSTHEDLDKTFNIQPDEVESLDIIEKKPKVKPLVLSDKKDDREKDYQYARAQLYNIVEKMQESLDSAMEVAQESEHPRAFEVVFNGAKNAADVVDKINDLHKKMKDLEVEEVKVQQHNNTTNNIMMTGSTAELINMLKASQKEVDK